MKSKKLFTNKIITFKCKHCKSEIKLKEQYKNSLYFTKVNRVLTTDNIKVCPICNKLIPENE